MSGGLREYPAYRDSGLPWLDAIPAHWEVRRAKYYLREADERSLDGTEERLSVSHLTGVTPRREKNITMFEAESYVGHKLCHPGDVVVNTMWAWMGALGVARHRGIVSPAYGVYRPLRTTDFEPAFLDYLLRTPDLVAEYVRRSTGIQASRLRLYAHKFLDIALPCPPIEEQRAICKYLDAHRRLVRGYERAKRQIIALLDEERAHAVRIAAMRGTGGSIAIKPINLPWLPEVPEHWEARHLGSEVRVLNGYPFDAAHFAHDRGHPLVRIRDIASQTTTIRYDGDDVPEARIEHGDLLVGMDGDFNAALWAGSSALLNQRVCCVRPGDRVDREFLALVLPLALSWINAVTLSTTVKHLSSADIRRIRVPMPNIEEQRQVVEHVRTATAPLIGAKHRIERELALIAEYRTRTVSDVVTGQLDVRELARILSDVAEEIVNKDTSALLDAELSSDEEELSDLAAVTSDAD